MQDFTLFVLLGEKSIDIWTRKLDWVASKGGMALLNSHPDYMNFSGSSCGAEEYPVKFYREFLEYARRRSSEGGWPALPKTVWSHCVECFQRI